MSAQDNSDLPEGAIAIVGIGCRFPGANDPETFWYNLRDGVESIVPLSDEELRAGGVSESDLSSPDYVKRAATLEGMEMFDAGFFGFSPKEASIMDPQHRQFLECCWEAFENAGHVPENFDGAIGVFAGCGMNTYFTNHLAFNSGLMKDPGYFLVRHIGNDKDFLPTRVAYQFDLKGPSISVQTACSTSLVAVHLAVQSLLSGESDMALAGGATIELPHRQGYLYQDGEILSHDGHCRSFDAESTGTVFGSGAGAVLLRRLEDALENGDHIYATILGSAINNDGSDKVSFLAPSVGGQANAVSEALAVSGIGADSVTYVETHGTGTQIGDPIEIAALTQAFRETTDAKGFCALSAVKSNIGHLDTAAGVAGLIKVALSLENRKIPPVLHFKRPNPKIDFPNTPFFINSELSEWELPEGVHSRRATINSLGVGGTNAHVVLEEAPFSRESEKAHGYQLLALSAKTKEALDGICDKLASFFERNPHANLADAAYSLQIGRKGFQNRRVLAVSSREDAITCLKSKDKERVYSGRASEKKATLVFMFPGGGTQYSGMGADLYEKEPVYQDAWNECIDVLGTELSAQIKRLVYADPSKRIEASRELERPSLALPSLLATEYAFAKLLFSWGVEPEAFVGHSMGEYTAACLSGVFSIADAVRLVRARGELFEKIERGGMLSINLSESETRKRMPDSIDIAAVNAPELCVASGPVDEIVKFHEQLEGKEIDCTRIHIDVAAHSSMLEPILDEFREFCKTITYSVPQKPFASNLTGNWVDAEQATDPEYWVQHLRSTVKFADCVSTILDGAADYVLVEIGPGRTLSSLARAGEKQAAGIFNSMRHPKEAYSDVEFALRTLGKIWVSGVDTSWSHLWKGQIRKRIPLPTYAFDHSRYWIEPSAPTDSAIDRGEAIRKRPNINEWFSLYAWAQSGMPKPKEHLPSEWLVFSDHAGFSAEVMAFFEKAPKVTVVESADSYGKIDQKQFKVNPESEADFKALFSDLEDLNRVPDQIVYFWTVSPQNHNISSIQKYDTEMKSNFWGLFNLCKSLAELSIPLSLTVVSSDMHTVLGELSSPGKSMLLGPVCVIPHEVPGVTTESIDIQFADVEGVQLKKTARQVARELMSENSDRVIAYRGNSRWVRRIERANIDPAISLNPWIREGGNYLVTGGLGGIGLEIAKFISRLGAERLILIGRSPLPKREHWDVYLSSHSTNDRKAKRILAIREVETLGAQVITLQADAADLTSSASAVRAAKEICGELHGVIHAAGLMDDEIIALKSEESARRVLGAKAKGAVIFDFLTKEEPLDFFVVFSSVASFLGLQGQIDYAAANSFLDAFARDREARGPGRSLAINWNAWKEVGMAVDAKAMNSTGTPLDLEKGRTGHPALGDAAFLENETVLFSHFYSLESDWLLDEHRVKNAEALIPGTGFIDLLRAATEFESEKQDWAIELEDVQFLSPFQISGHQQTALNIKREPQGSGYRLVAYSVSEEDLHVTAFGRRIKSAPLRGSLDIESVRGRCREKGTTRGRHMDQEFLDFGPRWGCVEAIHYGDAEAIVDISLPKEFFHDLESYKAHPAMLDMATGSSQRIVKDFSPKEDFFVPVAYDKVILHRDFPSTIVSHVVWHPGSAKELAKYDITIATPSGEIIAEIEGFTMKRVDASSIVAKRDSSRARGSEETLLETIIREAITPEEGIEAFSRVMSGTEGPQWIISSVDPILWKQQLDAQSRASDRDGDENDGFARASRPAVDSEYVAPRNPTEEQIVEVWKTILGIDEIGIEDDFFELGGHSLLLTRAAARIRKELSINVPLGIVFENPTISQLAAEIDKLKNSDSKIQVIPELKAVSREKYRSRKPISN